LQDQQITQPYRRKALYSSLGSGQVAEMARTIQVTVTDFASLKSDADSANEGSVSLGGFIAGHPFADGLWWVVKNNNASGSNTGIAAQAIDSLTAGAVNGQTIIADNTSSSSTGTTPPTPPPTDHTPPVTGITLPSWVPAPVAKYGGWIVVGAVVVILAVVVLMRKGNHSGGGRY